MVHIQGTRGGSVGRFSSSVYESHHKLTCCVQFGSMCRPALRKSAVHDDERNVTFFNCCSLHMRSQCCVCAFFPFTDTPICVSRVTVERLWYLFKRQKSAAQQPVRVFSINKVINCKNECLSSLENVYERLWLQPRGGRRGSLTACYVRRLNVYVAPVYITSDGRSHCEKTNIFLEQTCRRWFNNFTSLI